MCSSDSKVNVQSVNLVVNICDKNQMCNPRYDGLFVKSVKRRDKGDLSFFNNFIVIKIRRHGMISNKTTINEN